MQRSIGILFETTAALFQGYGASDICSVKLSMGYL